MIAGLVDTEWVEVKTAQAVVNDLAQQLGLPVVLEDDHQQPLAFSPHYDLSDRMRMDTIMRLATSQEVVDYFTPWGLSERRRPFVVPGNPDIDVLPRLCVPIRSGSGGLGFLWVLLPDSKLDEGKIKEAEEAAATIKHLLLIESEVRHSETELALRLLSSTHGERLEALSMAEGRYRIGIDRPSAIVLCSGPAWREPAVKARFWNTAWSTTGREQIRAVTDSEGLAIITDASSVEQLRRIHEAALADLSRVVAHGKVNQLSVGVSDWVASPAELPEAYRQAQIAARVTSTVSRNCLGYWAELGIYRFLGQLSTQMLLDGVDSRVRALIDEAPLLARTAYVYLENAGSAGATAKALGIHRATLYARLDRISRRGFDVRRGDDLLNLHIGLSALELAGYTKISTNVS